MPELDADRLGDGSGDDINWLLKRGYPVQGNNYSGKRTESLAQDNLTISKLIL